MALLKWNNTSTENSQNVNDNIGLLIYNLISINPPQKTYTKPC